MLTGHRRRLHDVLIQDQRGFSLVELLVVIVLLGAVGAVVTASIVSGTQSLTKGHARIDALNDLQKGLDRIGRELRAADPLVLDPGRDYANKLGAEVTRDGRQLRYTYYLVTTAAGTELQQDIEVLDSSGAVVSSETGLFITSIANPSMSPPVPMFRYYDGAGAEISCDDLDTTTGAGQSACRDRHLTAAQVRFTIARELPRQEPIVLQSVVNVRNTRFDG